MGRSIINEFKGSNSTLFHSTVLGTNSLLAQRSPKEHEMFKSRIAHLPADHRQDLSKKLDFVVVFQSIEIERLTQQIAFLRGRLKEHDGRIHNASSYEIQIRQLMEKCNKLENEKYSYREELSQTKDASQNIFNELSILRSRYADVDFCVAEKYKLEKARNEELCLEIQKWKSRYNSLEKIKGQELDGYKRLYESQKSSMVGRDSKDFLAKFQMQKEELLGKLRDRKEQLDERQLEIKKLQNYYEQLQVRAKEDNAKIESYEEKVALLSQQTFRLNQMMRAKQEEIRSIKLMHEQDFSLRMSRFTSLDETKNQLNDRVRTLQDQNDELREQKRVMAESISHLKRKISETERLEFQIRQAKTDSDSKLKAMERKDKRIIQLEEEAKHMKSIEGDIKRLYSENGDLKNQLKDLQQRLDEKIEQLRLMKQQQITFLRWRDDFSTKMQSKLNEYEQLQQRLQCQFSQQRLNAEQILKDSSNYQLRIKEFSIQLKEKDYKISSLQNELKQMETREKIKQTESKGVIQQLEKHLFAERRSFQQKMKDMQAKGKENERYAKQAEQRLRQADTRYRQIQSKFRDYQSSNNASEIKARNLQAQCNDLQSWGRSLQANNRQLQLHVQQLQLNLSQADEENMQLKHVLEEQHQFYRTAEQRYFQIGQQLKSLKLRLENIEKLLITLKTNITLKLKSAQESDHKIHMIQEKYEELFQWFITLYSQLEREGDRYKDSPIKKRYNQTTSDSFRFSPIRQESNFPSSPLHRARSLQRTRQNLNPNNRDPQIPSQFLLRHVLLCIQVESLRKRIGDKNAKVESLRSSIASKGSIQAQPSGFFSSRDTSLSKKQNILNLILYGLPRSAFNNIFIHMLPHHNQCGMPRHIDYAINSSTLLVPNPTKATLKAQIEGLGFAFFNLLNCQPKCGKCLFQFRRFTNEDDEFHSRILKQGNRLRLPYIHDLAYGISVLNQSRLKLQRLQGRRIDPCGDMIINL